MRSIGFKANVEAIENAMLNNDIPVERQSILYHINKCRKAYMNLEKKAKGYKKERLTKAGLQMIGLTKKEAA